MFSSASLRAPLRSSAYLLTPRRRKPGRPVNYRHVGLLWPGQVGVDNKRPPVVAQREPGHRRPRLPREGAAGSDRSQVDQPYAFMLDDERNVQMAQHVDRRSGLSRLRRVAIQLRPPVVVHSLGHLRLAVGQVAVAQQQAPPAERDHLLVRQFAPRLFRLIVAMHSHHRPNGGAPAGGGLQSRPDRPPNTDPCAASCFSFSVPPCWPSRP